MTIRALTLPMLAREFLRIINTELNHIKHDTSEPLVTFDRLITVSTSVPDLSYPLDYVGPNVIKPAVMALLLELPTHPIFYSGDMRPLIVKTFGGWGAAYERYNGVIVRVMPDYDIAQDLSTLAFSVPLGRISDAS